MAGAMAALGMEASKIMVRGCLRRELLENLVVGQVITGGFRGCQERHFFQQDDFRRLTTLLITVTDDSEVAIASMSLKWYFSYLNSSIFWFR